MLTAVTGDIYNNIHEQNVLTCSTNVLSALEVNINVSLCTRDNRCQGPFTCCRQLLVSCLQFNYLRVETLTPTWDTLTPTWEDFVGRFCRTILRVTLSSSPTKLVSDLRVWSLIYIPMYSRQSMPRPFHLLQTVAGLHIGCVCSFTCLSNVGRTNPGK
jgi:hypothetical protein